MKNLIISIILLFPFILLSQKEINLDNNLTGMYYNSDNTSHFGVTILGVNSLIINKFKIDLNTNYSSIFNPKISSNELVQRLNIGQNKDRWNLFSLYQINYSLIREMNSNLIGVGIGFKKKLKRGKLSLSYASIYERIDHRDNTSQETIRHSIRGRFIFENKIFGLSSEYFYQPSMISFKDVTIYGSSKLVLFSGSRFNLLIQDIINYRSKSSVKLIHNITFGVGYQFKKKIEKKIKQSE
jgi:hypothetical protein